MGKLLQTTAPSGNIIRLTQVITEAPIQEAPREVAPKAEPTRELPFSIVIGSPLFVLLVIAFISRAYFIPTPNRSLSEEPRFSIRETIVRELGLASDVVENEQTYVPDRRFVNKRRKGSVVEPVSAVSQSAVTPFRRSLVEHVYEIIRSTNRRQGQARRLAQSIVSESQRQNFDPLFAAAVIKSESAFNELAKSGKGAQGLMQILPSTGAYVARSSDITWPKAQKLTDAGYNIHLGITYLKQLEQIYDGNRLLVLIAYNWGPGKLDRAIKSTRGVPAEVMRYALKILRDHNLWQGAAQYPV